MKMNANLLYNVTWPMDLYIILHFRNGGKFDFFLYRTERNITHSSPFPSKTYSFTPTPVFVYIMTTCTRVRFISSNQTLILFSTTLIHSFSVGVCISISIYMLYVMHSVFYKMKRGWIYTSRGAYIR